MHKFEKLGAAAAACLLCFTMTACQSTTAPAASTAATMPEAQTKATVAGCPARVIKTKDEKTASKTALVDALRKL